MRGVGPAGRWFIALSERGRRMVVNIGGRRRVGGRMLIRKDYGLINAGAGTNGEKCIPRICVSPKGAQ